MSPTIRRALQLYFVIAFAWIAVRQVRDGSWWEWLAAIAIGAPVGLLVDWLTVSGITFTLSRLFKRP